MSNYLSCELSNDKKAQADSCCDQSKRLSFNYLKDADVNRKLQKYVFFKQQFAVKLANLRKSGQFQTIMHKVEDWIDDNTDMLHSQYVSTLPN